MNVDCQAARLHRRIRCRQFAGFINRSDLENKYSPKRSVIPKGPCDDQFFHLRQAVNVLASDRKHKEHKEFAKVRKDQISKLAESSSVYYRGFDANHRRQALENCVPRFAAIFRTKKFSAPGAKVNPRGLQAVSGQAIAEHCFQSILLRQSILGSNP